MKVPMVDPTKYLMVGGLDNLANLQERVASMPDLPLLASRLELLNASVVNMTSMPTRIADAVLAEPRVLDLRDLLRELAHHLPAHAHCAAVRTP